MSNSHTIRLFVWCLALAACGGGAEDTDKKPSTTDEPEKDAADGGPTSEAAGKDGSGAAGAAGGRSMESGKTAGSGGSAGKPAADGGSKAPPPTAGTGGTGGTGGAAGAAGEAAPSSPDRDAISAALADAICAALEKCVGPTKLAQLNSREDCKARYTQSFRQDELGTLDASLEAGFVKIDAAQLEACYSDTRALGCAVQADRLPASCQAAIAGQQGEGAVCSLDADCKSDLFCPIGDACPRSCQPVRAAAESCTRDSECKRGLLCTEAKCAAPSKNGEACGGASGKVCALGLSCVGNDETTAGKCQTNATVQSGALNAVCMPGGTLCKEGLSCAFDGSSGFKCVAAVAKGATCRLALPSQCPLDTYCNATDVTSTGKCVALPGAGEACVLGDDCAAGHLCVVKDDTAICQRISDTGESCESDALCRSGVCDTTCVLRDRCE